MNEFDTSMKLEKLESVILNIINFNPEEKMISPNITMLEDLRKALDNIFDDNHCTDVIYTLNTDKEFFGVKVNPAISAKDALLILTTDEDLKFDRYQLELDSKLFNFGLSEDEIAAVIIYEIAAIMDSNDVFDKVRAQIDISMITDNDVISIRDSINYAQLIIYALKDALYRASSMFFTDDKYCLTNNNMIQALDLQDSIIAAEEKLESNLSNFSDPAVSEHVNILKWILTLSKNMSINSRYISDKLKDVRLFTASKIEINEINKTIKSIDRIDSTIVANNESLRLDKFFDKNNLSSLNEISLFKNLRQSGLRAIENDLYEYAVRVKSCETQDDAIFILRGISTRLNLLYDYIANTRISDQERAHWEDVASRYQQLREILAKKNIANSKQYGIWFDYDKLDNLDQPSDNIW